MRKEVKVYLPFLTVSFVALVQGRTPTLVLALQLRHAGVVLLYQLAGLAMVLPHQLFHLLVLFPLLAHKALLLLHFLQSLSLQFYKTQKKNLIIDIFGTIYTALRMFIRV